MKHLSLMIIGLTLFLQAGCHGLSERQKTLTSEALKSLRKIDSAAEIGLNDAQYKAMLIEAKAQVNEATRTLPDGELKTELNAAMDTYIHSREVWKEIVSDNAVGISESDPLAQVLIPKYSLRVRRYGTDERATAEIDKKEAMNAILSARRKHLDRAAELSEK